MSSFQSSCLIILKDNFQKKPSSIASFALFTQSRFPDFYKAQKKRAVLNWEIRDDKVEITDEIAKETDAIISPPSKPIL